MRAVLDQLAATGLGADPAALLADPDEVTERVLHGAGRAVGRVLADVCTLLNPQMLVLGGSLGSQHPPFLAGVAWALGEYSGAALADRVEVVPAALGTDAEIAGGLVLAARTAAQRVAQLV